MKISLTRNLDFFIIAVIIALCLAAFAMTGHSQTTTISRRCPGAAASPAVASVAIDKTGNITFTACSGGTVVGTGTIGTASRWTPAQSTITASTPFISHTATWNSGAVTFRNLFSNVTCTACAAGSSLIDLQLGGVSRFKVTKAAGVTIDSGTSTTTIGDVAAVGNTITFDGSTGNTTISGTGTVFANNFNANADVHSATGSFSGTLQALTTIELGNASDTTLSRVSAGRVAVEGVNVPTISSTDTLTNKTLTNPGRVVQALTDAATITWDASSGSVATVTLAGSRTMAAPTNLKAGGAYVLQVTQDATGSRTITWNAAFKWPAATAPTLTTTAARKDLIECQSIDGSTLLCKATLDLR